MRYDLSKLPYQSLSGPVSAATAALVRLDERVAGSPIGQGWIARSHFADAAASMWIDGELVHLEDLVLHDAGADIRAPTHELSIARDILRTRRRIASHPSDWALSPTGLQRLRGDHVDPDLPLSTPSPSSASDHACPGDEETEPFNAADSWAQELAAMDAVIARSGAILSDTAAPARVEIVQKDPLVYEPEWNEEERLGEWHSTLAESAAMPGILRAAVALDAWNSLSVLQHGRWLGRLFAASLLREAGLAGGHLPIISTGLKSISRERRTSRDRNMRLLAFIDAITLAAEHGLREHDRLSLARQQMQYRVKGRRQNSKLPQLIELVLAKPLVSSGMIASELGVSAQGALMLASSLDLREVTGRGRFRAWGLL
jgi:hypothetical protein